MPLSPSTLPQWRRDLEDYSATNNLTLLRALLIGDKVMPEYPTSIAKADFFVVNRDQARRKHEIRHTPGAGFERIVTTAAQGFYDTVDYGLEIPCDKKRRSAYGAPIDWETEDSITLDYNLMLAHEARVAATVMDTKIFTPRPVNVLWSNIDTANPKQDVDEAYTNMRKRSAVPRDQLTLTISYATWQNLQNNAKLLASLNLTTSEMIIGTDEAKRRIVAHWLGIKDVLVGQASFISTPDGATNEYVDVWSDDYASLAHLAPGVNTPRNYTCLGRTIRWNEDMPSFITMETYHEATTDTDVTRARQFTDEFLQAADGEYACLLHVTQAKS